MASRDGDGRDRENCCRLVGEFDVAGSGVGGGDPGSSGGVTVADAGFLAFGEGVENWEAFI
jgi:hypothetical protein